MGRTSETCGHWPTKWARAARRLDSVRMVLGQQLGLPLGSRGPDAERFGQQWRYEGSQHLASAAAGLDNAAAALRRNALEQEVAGGVVCADVQTGRADVFSAEDLFDTNNVLSTAAGYFETISGSKLPGPIGQVMTGLGVLGSGGDVADLLGEDTGGRRIVGGLGMSSLILGLADLAKLPTNPLGLALGVAGGFIEATIPLGEKDYDEVLDMGSHHMFGRDAEDLTTAQRDMLSRRYEGPIGVANMISDKMDTTAEKVKDFFGRLF
ncbi:hypothetical protein MDOR_23020 [Mycolicibacterium doricum]|uniref:Uncharacterized protein n=2 Tax=Mycolicibacterium doricum TaxID=126673 RepID=A0A7I7VVH9_9MYCO|nr:hypothetical protein MDOR_23020 [Mycolicibacterium doricum]